MPLETKPLTKAQLAAYESKRDLASDLLQSIREMKFAQVHLVTTPDERAELHRRYAAQQANPSGGVPWKQVRALLFAGNR